MKEATVDDPHFGKLTWDGFQHEGWAGSFADAEYLSWGDAITAALPDNGDDDDEPASRTSSQDFLSEMLSMVCDDVAMDPKAAEMVRMSREFARRVDAYDGKLDADPLRRAGLLKVVVRNLRDNPPTAAQQAAWKAFRAGGKKLAEQVATALFDTYRAQRPERVRWWKAVYGDSPKATLPDVKTSKAMRAIVRPKEFRVYREQHGTADVAIAFESFWSAEDVKVVVRDGKVMAVVPLERSDGISTAPPPDEYVSPVFGPLKRKAVLDDGWVGTFHSDRLRGFAEATQTRHKFAGNRNPYTSAYRPGPCWESVTGDFELHVSCNQGQRPSPAQEAAFQAFNADPAATSEAVLMAVLAWYQRIRPRWIASVNGTAEEIDAMMPDLHEPEELLEIVELQSVTVLDDPSAMAPRFGPNAGKVSGAKGDPANVAIILSFHWEDEHGMAVRWRDGEVERVGDWESAEQDEYDDDDDDA